MTEHTESGLVQDVAVIGGSTAGLYAAYLLARGGLRVRVLEGADRLDPTPRTLIVTSRMRDLLGQLGEKAVVNEIRHFELFTDRRVARIRLQRPDLIIERSTLIRSLAEQGQASGAHLFFGRRFVGLQPNATGLAFTVELGRGEGTEEVRAETLIGADGTFSRVARAAGWPRQVTVPLVQAIVRPPEDLSLDTTRVWFIPEDTPYFYWLIPESADRAVVGLIGEHGQETRRCLERFLEKRGLSAIEYQGARIPLYTQWAPIHRRVGGGHVYLVGDAAGHVKVTTVGGIVTGLRGALGVSEAILNGGSSRELRVLRRDLNLHLLIRRTLHRFTQADYSGLLDLLHTSARRSLSLYTRDEAHKLLWNLSLRQPRLLLLGLRSLMTNGSFPRRRAMV